MGAFQPFESHVVRWRPASGDGLEHLTVTAKDDSIVARSVVIGERGGIPYGVRYTIACDSSWKVQSLDLETTAGQELHLQSDGNGRWTDTDGRARPDFDGCIDVDLAGTPFTNTLPIRRLDLDMNDGTVELSMLYIPFDTFAPTVDGQRYRCLESGRLFRYEAADRSFTADLPVDGYGFVLDYPTLFARI